MAICVKCNQEIKDGAKFCPFCGATQAEATASAPVQNEAPQPTYSQPAPAPAQSAISPQPAPAPAQSAVPPQHAPAPAQSAIPPQQPAYGSYAIDYSDHTMEFDKNDISENKVFAMAPYLLSFIGVIIALIASRDSKYVAFHVRQALKLEITLILCSFFSIIPFLGWIATGVCYCIILVLTIIAFFQVCGGKAKEPAIIKNLKFLK